MLRSLIVTSCLVLLVNAVQYAPEVSIEGGTIRGLLANLTTGHVVRKYLGIRFAKADRFKAPTSDTTKWSGLKDMITFGKECPQFPFSISNQDMSEDCLNLNVFVPDTSSGSSKLPVMVWVHGGAYVGGSNKPYNGSYISTLGNVVVVVINYRLTVFGFLATGENGDLKGNYGMLDQVEALKWVQRNIKGFGGDPNKVTIFGESAGGSSVSLLMLSPLTKGLFKNVIMQSGAAVARWAASSYKDVEEITRLARSCLTKNRAVNRAEKINFTIYGNQDDKVRYTSSSTLMIFYCFGPRENEVGIYFENGTLVRSQWPRGLGNKLKFVRTFGKRIGCTNFDAIAQCLKTKSLGEILNAAGGDTLFAPVIDGHFLPDAPVVLLHNGNFQKLNIIVGVTDDDGTVVIGSIPGLNVKHGIGREYFKGIVKSKLLKSVINQKPPLPAAMIYRYTDWTNVSDPYRNRRMFLDMMTDVMFTVPAIQCAKAFVNHSLTTYFYQLQHRLDGATPSWIRAYHGADIPYVFGFPLSLNASLLNTKEANFSRDIIRLWTNFAKTGDPNNPESVQIAWPQYDLNSQQYIAFKPTMAIGVKLRAEYVAFWNEFIPEALHSLPSTEPCNYGNKMIPGLLNTMIFALLGTLLGVGF